MIYDVGFEIANHLGEVDKDRQIIINRISLVLKEFVKKPGLLSIKEEGDLITISSKGENPNPWFFITFKSDNTDLKISIRNEDTMVYMPDEKKDILVGKVIKHDYDIKDGYYEVEVGAYETYMRYYDMEAVEYVSETREKEETFCSTAFEKRGIVPDDTDYLDINYGGKKFYGAGHMVHEIREQARMMEHSNGLN